MRRHVLSVLTGLLLSVLGMGAFGQTAAGEYYTLTPADHKAFAGSKVEYTFRYKGPSGSAFYAWYVPIERRNTPKGFFENTKRPIFKNPSNFNYDNIRLMPYQTVQNGKTEGEVKFTLDLRDFVPGNYKFMVNAKFMLNGQQITKITEGRLTVEKPPAAVAGSAAPEEREYFRLTPAVVTAAVGDTVDFSFDFKTGDGSTFYAWFVPLARKDSPKGFFEATKRPLFKFPKNTGYDHVRLMPYQVTKNPRTQGSEKFTIQLYDFVPGTYKFAVNAKFMLNGQQITKVAEGTLVVEKTKPPARRELKPGEGAKLSDYLIYCPDKAEPSVKKAALFLQKMIRIASGVMLPIYNEPLAPFIAVGASEAAVQAGIHGDQLPYDGYVLKKKDNNIFIVGREIPDDGLTAKFGHSYGTTAGVRAFLENKMGILWLLPGEKGLYFPKITADYQFGDMDDQFTPRFEFRLFWTLLGSSKGINEWLEYNQVFSGHCGSKTYGAPHSWLRLYPSANMQEAKAVPDRDKTFREHPEFFQLSADGRRVHPPQGATFSLCLGTPGTTEDIIQRIPRLMEQTWQRNPQLRGMKHFSLTPNDNAPYCSCRECTKYCRPLTPEETGMVSYKLHTNWTELVFNSIRKVCERLTDYTFGCYIYHSTEYPYPGIKPMPKNFYGIMCPLHCGYGPVRYCDGINQTWHKWLNSWDGIFADMGYYGLDFWLRQHYGAPQPPCIRIMKDTFQELSKRPFTAVEFYANAGYGQCGMSTWVLAKMIWDPTQDPEKLACQYLEAAYGEKAAPYMKQLYQTVEDKTRDFYNMYKGVYGWDLDAEMLTDLYAPVYPKLEELYLKAAANPGDENQQWRLAMFGENMKMFRYTLVSLGLLENTDSPLKLTPAQYDKLNRSRLPGGNMFDYLSPTPQVSSCVFEPKVTSEITDELKGQGTYQPFSCQAGREFWIIPRKDGICTLVFESHTMRKNEVKGRNYLPAIPLYSIYNEDHSLYLSGMADKGVVKFDVKKGRRYHFVFNPCCDFAIRPYWYLKSCSEPYAIGHNNDGEGFRFYEVKSPLWFYVEDSAKDVEIFMEHTYVRAFDVDLKDPDEKIVASVHRKNASDDAISVPAKKGWWKLEFNSERGFCGYLRFGNELTKYVVTDPDNAVKVTHRK